MGDGIVLKATWHKWAVVAGGAVTLFGGSVLLFGWLGDSVIWRRFSPSLPDMSISTASGFVLCGLCLLLDRGTRYRKACAVFAAAGFVLAAINLLLLASGSPGVDHLAFDFADARAEAYMAPATSICLLLSTACLLLWRPVGSAVCRELYACLAGTGLFVAGLSLVGHIFDSDALHGVFFFGAMALPTTLGFMLLFPALLVSRPDWGFMNIYTGDGLGSAMLRRTLPFAVLGPLTLCWLTLMAVEAGLFEVNFRLSVLATAMTIMLIGALTWAALRENAAAEHIVETNERLRQAISDRDILLKEVYHRVKNNLQFVDAMLALESNALDGNGAAERLADVRARLHALALVHQQLVAAQDLASLNLESFLKELCRNMAKGTGVDTQNITLTVDAAPVSVHLDYAIPIGLVVTELIANAVKYAFPEERGGEILVLAQDLGERGLSISVSDNGVGRSSLAGNRESVGHMILRSLANQLDASITEKNLDGYHVELLIPLERV